MTNKSILYICMMLCITTTYANNLVFNGSFEEGFSEWKYNKNTMAIDGQDSFEGSKSIMANMTQGEKSWLKQTIPLNEGTYRSGFYYKAAGNFKTCRLALLLNGDQIAKVNLPNKAQWTYVSVEDIKVTYASDIEINIYTISDGNCSISFDDFRFETDNYIENGGFEEKTSFWKFAKSSVNKPFASKYKAHRGTYSMKMKIAGPQVTTGFFSQNVPNLEAGSYTASLYYQASGSWNKNKIDIKLNGTKVAHAHLKAQSDWTQVTISDIEVQQGDTLNISAFVKGSGSVAYYDDFSLTKQPNNEEEEMAVHAPISAGNNHTMYITEDQTLWGHGNNQKRQLGTTLKYITNKPLKILTDVISVSAGNFHSLFLRNDNSLWVAGYNSHGQLGTNRSYPENTPRKIMEDVQSIAAGFSYSLVVKKDGSLWITGNSPATSTSYFLKYTNISNVKSVSAGIDHMMIIKDDDSLWGIGNNTYGELGDGTTNQRMKPKFIMNNVADVKAGYLFSMILKKDGSLWGAGLNDYGQLGNGTKTDAAAPVHVMNNVADMAIGNKTTMILKTDGSLWATGKNSQGEFGNGTKMNSKSPVQVMSDVIFVSCGENHSMAVKSDGSIWGTGANDSGEIGDRTFTDKDTWVECNSIY